MKQYQSDISNILPCIPVRRSGPNSISTKHNRVGTILRSLLLIWSLTLTLPAVPLIDNNAGTWEDNYPDKTGISSRTNLIHRAFAGSLALDGSSLTGEFVTVEIEPPSFYGWETVCLEGLYGDPSQMTVDVLESDTLNPVLSGLHPDASGCMDISSLGNSPASIRLRVRLSRPTLTDPPPLLTRLTATWDPKSVLLIDKQAPDSVLAGQAVIYQIRFSVNYVDATNVVIWDRLPAGALGTVLYPTNVWPQAPYPGQNDDPFFAVGLPPGATVWTGPGSTNVFGQAIPANSVLWAFDELSAGDTEILRLAIQSKNGTLTGTLFSNRVMAVAGNADAVQSDWVQTEILSSPAPRIDKRGGNGIIRLPEGNFALPESTVTYVLANPIGKAGNLFASIGRETMYDVILWDDVSQFLSPTPLIDTNLGVNGFQNISGSDWYYDANFLPPGGTSTIPAIVWTNVSGGVLSAGEPFFRTFDVTFIPAANGMTITNVVGLDSDQTSPIYDSLPVTLELNTDTTGIYSKDDDLNGRQSIQANHNEDETLATIYGGSYDYQVGIYNGSMVGARDVVMLDKIPDDVWLQSAFAAPGIASGTVFYATTTNYPDNMSPPPFDYTAAPGDFDVPGSNLWSSTPPSAISNVTWVAFYFPAVDSYRTMASSPIPKRAYGKFRVKVKPAIDPCVGKRIKNWSLFHTYNLAFPGGGGGPHAKSFPSVADWENTLVKPRIAVIDTGDRAKVQPSTVRVQGDTTYTLQVVNRNVPNSDVLRNPFVDFTWGDIQINGISTVPSYVSLTGGTVDWANSDLANGSLRVRLSDLAPGDGQTLKLRLSIPVGAADGASFQISARLDGDDDACEFVPFNYKAQTVTLISRPKVDIHKSRDLGLIPSGGQVTYTIDYENLGTGPSHQTWIVDRIPTDSIFISAHAPQAMEVRFSDNLTDLPPAVSTFDHITLTDMAQFFSPGTNLGSGVWMSPLAETVWVAFRVDDDSITPPQLSLLAGGSVSFTVQNDEGGPEIPSGAGSLPGTQIFNESAVFSKELIQAIGNEVVTLIAADPGLVLNKHASTDVLFPGETFTWQIDYYNNSGTEDNRVTLFDELPAGVEFLGARHVWNSVALANGAAPTNEVTVSPIITVHSNGSRTIELEIAPALRAGDLFANEGGSLILDVRIPESTPAFTVFNNRICGLSTNPAGEVVACDEDPVQVRNPDLYLRKSSNPKNPTGGDVVTFTLLLSNEGYYEARNVSLIDTLPSGVTYLNGTARVIAPAWYQLSEPAVMGSTLVWDVAHTNAIEDTRLSPAQPGWIEPLSGNILISYQGIVASNVPSGTLLTNIAVTANDLPEDDVYPNTSNAVVRTPFPDPTVTKTGPDLVAGGDSLTWRIAYRNLSNQDAHHVWLIDTLPDIDGDPNVDVTYIFDAPNGPGAVSTWYHAGPSSPVPAFDPTNAGANATAGWVSSPAGMDVSHIAWSVGMLPRNSAIYTIEVNARLVDPGDGTDLTAGLALTNSVEIFTTDPDENPTNNIDQHPTRTPGVDLALEKSGSIEGVLPGSIPGQPLTYTMTWRNSGTVTAYGLKIEDEIPAEVTLDSPPDNFLSVALAQGQAVDLSGTPLVGSIPVTRVQAGAKVTWFLGTTAPGDDLYYQKIGFTVGASGSFQVYTTLRNDLAEGTVVSNVATVMYDGPPGNVIAEEYLVNNTDDTYMNIWLPDLAVRKVGQDTSTRSYDYTEAGHFVDYRIEFNNLGIQMAENVTLIDRLPPGTTFDRIVGLPPGASWSLLDPATLQIDLGTLNAPAGLVGVPENRCIDLASSVVRIHDGENGMSSDIQAGDGFGYHMVSAGDLDGDGVEDLLVGARANSDGEPQAGAVWIVYLNPDGTVKNSVELADGLNGFPAGVLDDYARIGEHFFTPAGDVNGDGIQDLIIGVPFTPGFFEPDNLAGAAWVLMLETNGTVKTAVQLANGTNGIPANAFAPGDTFAISGTMAGDIDGNGVPDFVVGARGNDDEWANSGAVWVILLNPDGTAKSAIELANGTNGVPPTSFYNAESMGTSVASADIDGDGIPDVAAGAPNNSNGGSSGTGGIWLFFLNADGTARELVELTNGENGMPLGSLLFGDRLGDWVTLEDIDGDGTPDVIAGSIYDDAGASDAGAVWIMLLNPDGTAKSVVELANDQNGIPDGTFGMNSQFGHRVAVGDLDNDGTPDLVAEDLIILLNPDGTAKYVGTRSDSSDGPFVVMSDLNGDGFAEIASARESDDSSGSVWITFPDHHCEDGVPGGTFLDGHQVVQGQLDVEIPIGQALPTPVELANGLNGVLSNSFSADDRIGFSVAAAGDIDGDGVPDAVAGSQDIVSFAAGPGAAWVFLLNADGTTKSAIELSNGTNGIPAGSFAAQDNFGSSVSSAGDVDGDGVPDLLVGAQEQSGAKPGAVWVILLNSNGTAKASIEMKNGTNGIPAGSFVANDAIGAAVASIGDVDGNGVPDMITGAIGNDDGGSAAGAVWVILLNSNGTAKSAVELADNKNGMSSALQFADFFGDSVAAAGDINGDGIPDLFAGARLNDDGNSDAGGVWVILLETNGTAKSAIELANGLNGIPPGSFAGGTRLGRSVVGPGDVDGDGVPDLVAGVLDSNNEAIWVILLNSNGTAKSAVELRDGQNGMPDSLEISDGFGEMVAAAGDIDQDGVPDLLAGARWNDAVRVRVPLTEASGSSCSIRMARSNWRSKWNRISMACLALCNPMISWEAVGGICWATWMAMGHRT